jgi:hypothetical protein
MLVCTAPRRNNRVWQINRAAIDKRAQILYEFVEAFHCNLLSMLRSTEYLEYGGVSSESPPHNDRWKAQLGINR